MPAKQLAYHHLKKLGVGLKETDNSHEFYSQLMNLKPAQLMVAKHIVHQAIGGKPTHFHPKYEHDLEKKHIQALRKSGAIRHFDSPHKLAEFYRMNHTKGGSLGSAFTKVMNGVKKVGKTAAKYVKQGAEWALKNPDKVKQAFETVKAGVDVLKTLTSKEESKIDFDKDPFTTDDDEKKPGGSLVVKPVPKTKVMKYRLWRTP